jgi:hypothetical protein
MIDRVKAAQKFLGIPWDYVAQNYHEGLTPAALADQVNHWEARAAERGFHEPCTAEGPHTTGGGRRVIKKRITDDEENPGVRQEND